MAEIIVAGVFSLLSVIVGILAYAWNHDVFCEEGVRSEEKTNIRGGAEKLAAIISGNIMCQSVKQWVLIAVSTALVGIVVYRLQVIGLHVVLVSRLVVTAFLLLPAMIIDWETRRIPNGIILVMLGMGMVFLILEFVFYSEIFTEQLISCGGGLLGFLILFYLMARLTKEGIGMGDVKLIASQGWLVGIVITLASTLFSLLLCSVVAVLLLLSKKKKANDQIPFGPFIFFGYMVALLVCNL